MKFLTWTIGRHSSFAHPYFVKSLLPEWFSHLFEVELFLTKYCENSCIKPRVLSSKWWSGYDAYQTDLELQSADKGGHLQFFGTKGNPYSLNILGRLFGYRTQSYRPDIMPHLMTTLISGEKRVLSWRRYKKTSRKPLSVANAQTAKDYFEIYKALLEFSRNINCKRYVDVNLCDLEPVRISMNKYSDKQQIVVDMVAMNRATNHSSLAEYAELAAELQNYIEDSKK